KVSDLSSLFHAYNELSDTFLKIKTGRDFLEKTLQSIREGLFVIEVVPSADASTTSLQIRGLNPAAASMLDRDEAALKNTDLRQWIDTDYVFLLNHLHTQIGSEAPLTLEGQLRKKYGAPIPLELSWAPVQSEGQGSPFFVIMGRDIRWKKDFEKELRLKEELLKESQSMSKTGSFRWDLISGKSLWSEEEYNILGVPHRETTPSYDFFRSLVLPEDLEIFDKAISEARHNIRPFHVDFRLKKYTSSEIIWVRCQGRTEYNEAGHAVCIYGTTQDVTELRRVERSLIAAKDEALRSSQAKTEFLARMSHEIRTPMNAIMGMAELLRETKLDKDQLHYVTIFCKAGEVLMSLLNDILDLSKIEAGEVSVENISFDLNKIMIDVEEMMRSRAAEKGLRYSFEIHPSISPYLMGDPNKVRQILVNLVGNSFKFTDTGHIRITAGKNPSKKDSLLISVSDSGVGIPASKQHVIFQKFSQADSSITRRYGGTGLGLAISKSLVELMGGQIWFKSREGRGTTFFFTLPYREQQYQLVTPKSVTVPLPKPSVSILTPTDSLRKIRILIADDTDDNRTLFSHFLKNGPYEIIEAENGLEALDKIKSQQFDMIFMDVQMPEMDGYAATSHIRQWEKAHDKSALPIIALTAHALSEDRQKSLRAGCNDHIAKPFKRDTLLEVISRYSS
ncbi:MAG: ATP-binding protein, partial [Bdellovibrio sp.]